MLEQWYTLKSSNSIEIWCKTLGVHTSITTYIYIYIYIYHDKFSQTNE